jgi:phenylacetate-coenzyme A ligase PaaK-like adenylate-forming protein
MRVPVGIRRFKRKSTQHRRLPFPAAPGIRTAQVTATTFFEDVEAFSYERWAELESFHPRILVGPASDLRRVAEQVELGTLDLKSVDCAVFVLTACGGTPVSDVVRVVLWQSFGVPVYELLVGVKDILLACECQLQEGWHPQPYAIFSVH